MGASQSSEPEVLDVETSVPDENLFEESEEEEEDENSNSNPLDMNWFWPFM